jgi:glycosyltransferase involved in cell wall biosynthesis
MHVLMISSGLDKKFGGPPEAVTGIACALRNLGVHPTVAIFGQTKEGWESSHFRETLKAQSIPNLLFPYPSTSRYGGLPRLKDLPILWNLISESDFVILHQVFNFQNIICSLIVRFQQKSFAVMPHGSMTSYQAKKHQFRKFLVSPIFNKGFLEKADRIFVATENEKEEIEKKWRNKTTIVGLGVTNKHSNTEQRKDINGVFTFIFMGRLAAKKRIDVALLSLKLATELSKEPIRLIVCGDGEQEIVEQVLKYQNSPGLFQVDYRGWVGGLEKEKLLNSADCFILTSEDENFAIAVAEALSYGVPSLISTKVALSNLVAKYSAGIVFHGLEIETIAIDAIKIMKSDPLELSENALNASEELTWDFVGKIWEREIKLILGLV